MNTEIYYFSGTGNSLHITRELKKRIPDTKLISIISLLNKNIIKTNTEKVGFVFPLYLTTVPAPVKKFLRKLDLISSKYIFTVMTRAGTFSLAKPCIENILKKKGKKLDSFFILNMGNNSPTGLKPIGDKSWTNEITEEKITILESKVQDELNLIKKIIINKEKQPKKNIPNPLKYLLSNLFTLITENTKTEIKYYTDQTCTGCGICEKICLSNKIKLANKKPVWQKDIQCYYCYACFNFCPEQAILVKKIYTLKNGRYHHPEISANDISEQKQ